jgi:WD40 repeat protein
MRTLAAIFILTVLTGTAQAQKLPDQRPMLRIEPGMHTAPIIRVGVDAACTLMVTGSHDKTARLWALPESGRGSPELLRTLRVPIGEGDEGKIYAVALSPDGRWVAAGGWDARYSADSTMAVYIFEAATGRLVTRLGHDSDAIFHLAFSPDGSRFAAMLGREGMRLWETAGWRLLAEDKDYGGNSSDGGEFDHANRLYTVAFDGQIRRYSADGRLEAKAATKGGKEPFGIAVHPQGTKLATGFNDTTAIDVYDASSLRFLYAADTRGTGQANDIAKVAWSADGSRLFAGGGFFGDNPIISWTDQGRGKRSQTVVSHNTVSGLLPCGRDIAVGAQDPAFGLIGADGSKRVWQEGVTADTRVMGQAFKLSGNGETVASILKPGSTDTVIFNLPAFSLGGEVKEGMHLTPPRTSGVAVTDWEYTYKPALNGKLIQLDSYEQSRALAVRPDASGFVLGTSFALRSFRSDGTQLWTKDVPSLINAVNITRDSRLAVASNQDGTLRWHRLSDGKELLALFIHAVDRRYVAWTPKGYYAASPGAEDLIGWHVNRDWDHAADFFPASRFHDQFNRPDIVKRVLYDLDEGTAIAEANRLAGLKPAPEIEKKLPPVITILSPAEGGAFTNDALTIRYNVRSPSGLTISEVSALVDGRPFAGATAAGFVPIRGSDGDEKSLTLKGLPPRDLTLSLVARGGDLESTPSSVRLKFHSASQPSAPPPSAPSVSLYALVAGVAKFKDPSINPLSWAAKDARDFAEALKRQGRLYRKVEVRLLTDEEADNGAILDGLTWLKRQVGQGDAGVVFLAGHGVTDPGGEYYYVPYNARLENVAGVPLPTRGSSVPDSEISRTLKQLAGNALFFFDTCHAGQAAGISFRGAQDYNKLINEIAGSANAIVLASSTGTELSQERDEWRQGAFTKALLEGLAGAADVLPKDGIVTIDELNLYVKERVKELTGGLQHPVDLRPKETRNIPFAMVP